MEASTGFPGTTWLASSRRFSGRFNGIYGDDFLNNQIKIITRSRNNRLCDKIFFFQKQAENQLLSEDNNISLQPKQMNNRSLYSPKNSQKINWFKLQYFPFKTKSLTAHEPTIVFFFFFVPTQITTNKIKWTTVHENVYCGRTQMAQTHTQKTQTSNLCGQHTKIFFQISNPKYTQTKWTNVHQTFLKINNNRTTLLLSTPR